MERRGNVSLTLLLAVGVCPLLAVGVCPLRNADFSTICSDPRTGEPGDVVKVGVGCNDSFITLTLGLRTKAERHKWLEYECVLPNGTTFEEAQICNPGGYIPLMATYMQSFEQTPLPDGAVCSVRGCFDDPSKQSYIFRFTAPDNCTVDTDECQEGTHDCQENSDCINIIGAGYECACKDGYSPLDNRNVNCTDTNECEEDRHNCGGNSTCNNTVGSFECVCQNGYYPSDKGNINCTDINECAESTHDCREHSTCSNIAGSYECMCQEDYYPLDDRNTSCGKTVPGSTQEDRETRQDITVGLTLSLILLLLLAALAPLLFYFAWRRHIQQRGRFRHYKFDVESKLDVTYDPGVLKVDAKFKVHSSVGSLFHELTYEREISSYSSAPQTIREETRIDKVKEGRDFDTRGLREGKEGGRERKSSSFENSDGEREGKNKTPLQLPPISASAGDGEDNNSCLLSPASIALELSSNDSNSSSEGSSRTASLRQSCGDAHSTGYVSETMHGSLNNGGGSSGATTITRNERDIPVFESPNDPPIGKTWQPHHSNTGMSAESPVSGYISDAKELPVASNLSGEQATPQAARKEDCHSNNRNPDLNYTSDSRLGAGCPSGGYVTRETSMSARERGEQQPIDAELTGKQQLIAQRNAVVSHQKHSKQEQIKQQQITEENSIQRTESSLSLNIITDLEQAFPLASRYASYESLDAANYLPENLPQLMPIKPDLRPLDLGTTGGSRGGGESGGYVDDRLSADLFVPDQQSDKNVSGPTTHITQHRITSSSSTKTTATVGKPSEQQDTPHEHHISPYTPPHHNNVFTVQLATPLTLQTRHSSPLVSLQQHRSVATSCDYVNLENTPTPSPQASTLYPQNNDLTIPRKPDTASSPLSRKSDTPSTDDDLALSRKPDTPSTDAVDTKKLVDSVAVTHCEEARSRASSPGELNSDIDDLFSDDNVDERGFANILFGLETRASHEDYIDETTA